MCLSCAKYRAHISTLILRQADDLGRWETAAERSWHFQGPTAGKVMAMVSLIAPGFNRRLSLEILCLSLNYQCCNILGVYNYTTAKWSRGSGLLDFYF